MDSNSDDDDFLPSLKTMTAVMDNARREGLKASTSSKKIKRGKSCSSSSTKKKPSSSSSISSTPKRPRFFNFDATPKSRESLASSNSDALTPNSSATPARFSKEIEDLINKADELNSSSKARKNTSRNERVDDDLDLSELLNCNVSDIVNGPSRESIGLELRSLKLKYKDKVWRTEVPTDSKISKVRMAAAEKLLLRADDIYLVNEQKPELGEIEDTVAVDDIPFGTVLEVNHRNSDTDYNCGNPMEFGEDFILLKVQGEGHHRQRITVPIRRTTHMQQLIDDYAKRFELQGKSFRLRFDGDYVNPSETPESLDLDGEEMFEILEVP